MATALAILLTVLKVLGIILLCILALILLLIILVLFVPVRLKGFADIKSVDDITAHAKVSYLLNLVRAIVDYKDKNILIKAKILFFTLVSESIDPKNPKSNNTDEESDNSLTVNESSGENSEENVEKKIGTEESADKQIETSDTDTDHPDQTEKSDTVSKAELSADEEEKEILESTDSASEEENPGLLDKISDGVDRIDHLKDRAEEFLLLPATQKVLRIGKKQLLKTLRGLRHFDLSGSLTAGFDNPETTGYIMAGYSIVSTVLPGWKILFTPDFEESRIEGNLKFKGRIALRHLVRPVLRLAVSPSFWKTIKTAKQLAKEEFK